MRHDDLVFNNPDTVSDSPTREQAKVNKNCRDKGEKDLTNIISSGCNFARVESSESLGESLDEGFLRHLPLFEPLGASYHGGGGGGSPITTRGFSIWTHKLYP